MENLEMLLIEEIEVNKQLKKEIIELYKSIDFYRKFISDLSNNINSMKEV